MYRSANNTGVCLRVSGVDLVGERTGSYNSYCCAYFNVTISRQYHTLVTMNAANSVKWYIDGVLTTRCSNMVSALDMNRYYARTVTPCNDTRLFSLHHWPLALTVDEINTIVPVTARYGRFTSAVDSILVYDTQSIVFTVKLSGQVYAGVSVFTSVTACFPLLLSLSSSQFDFPPNSTITSFNITVTGNLPLYAGAGTCLLSLSLGGADADQYDLPSGLSVTVAVLPVGECLADDGHLSTQTTALGVGACPSAFAGPGLNLTSKDYSFSFWFYVKAMTASSSVSARQIFFSVGTGSTNPGGALTVGLQPTTTVGTMSIFWSDNTATLFSASIASLFNRTRCIPVRALARST